MPTGYTHKILEDNNYTVEDFMMDCGERFGVPFFNGQPQYKTQKEADVYYVDVINEYIDHYEKLTKMTADEWILNEEKERNLAYISLKKELEEKNKILKKLNDYKFNILSRVYGQDMDQYRDFLVSQIDDTISQDASFDYVHSETKRFHDKEYCELDFENEKNKIKSLITKEFIGYINIICQFNAHNMFHYNVHVLINGEKGKKPELLVTEKKLTERYNAIKGENNDH